MSKKGLLRFTGLFCVFAVTVVFLSACKKNNPLPGGTSSGGSQVSLTETENSSDENGKENSSSSSSSVLSGGSEIGGSSGDAPVNSSASSDTPSSSASSDSGSSKPSSDASKPGKIDYEDKNVWEAPVR